MSNFVLVQGVYVCIYKNSFNFCSSELCLESAIVSFGTPSLVRNAGGGHRCPLLIMLNSSGQCGQHSGTLKDQKEAGGASCEITPKLVHLPLILWWVSYLDY